MLENKVFDVLKTSISCLSLSYKIQLEALTYKRIETKIKNAFKITLPSSFTLLP